MYRDASFHLGSWKPLPTDQANGVMDIVVENMGRINYGKPHDFVQRKGLWEGPVLLDEHELFDWKIIPLEFKGNWIRELKSWRPFSERPSNLLGPVVVRGTLNIQDSVADTFIDMSKWGKGVVFINGFNLGRYWSSVGPQQTLYLPAPFLKVGANTASLLMHYKSSYFPSVTPLIQNYITLLCRLSSTSNITLPPKSLLVKLLNWVIQRNQYTKNAIFRSFSRVFLVFWL